MVYICVYDTVEREQTCCGILLPVSLGESGHDAGGVSVGEYVYETGNDSG